MAKIVIDCSDPNDLEAVEKATEQAIGKCNITSYRQHEALIEAGRSSSISESARILSADSGDSVQAESA